MELERLRYKSTEIMAKLQTLKDEDYRKTYADWREWWNLSGTGDIGVMPNNTSFNYVLKTAPFDYWMATIDPQALVGQEDDGQEYSREEIDKMIKSIQDTISSIEKEEPHTIAFTSIPAPCGDVFELVGLAKISNNGTSYVFSNDLNYLKYLKSRGL